MVQSSNLTISFSSESSIEEELKRESTADVITIVVCCIEKKMSSHLSLFCRNLDHRLLHFID